MSRELCQKHISCPNAAIFLYFGYGLYFRLSLFKYQHEKIIFEVCKRTLLRTWNIILFRAEI